MIRANLDLQLVKNKISLTELSRRVGVTIANLSVLKQGKSRAIRFTTLNALCRELNCQPGDILEFEEDVEVLEEKSTKEETKENDALGNWRA
ncbi:MAG: transcriptional regulator [Calditrichaeota bacterium]|nr:MAG: transcriptional regulator [Calditrichota bacterium]